jgi:glyoxylase-like metal-dependent hydrolase (beta-lactamase superfamily II)
MTVKTGSREVFFKQLGPGIIELDSGYLEREAYAACYLIENNGEIAIIETSTNRAVPRILQAIEHLGFNRNQVKYVAITHVHLDHAGGAGTLIDSLPRAQLVVHSRGYRHMVDPQKLVESVKQVYGALKYQQLYGEVFPVPENRICPVKDYDVIKLGNENLLFLDTPGHAKHHLVVFDEKSRALFSGDAFGISYPRFSSETGRFILPSAAPVQFDPEKAKASFSKIVYLHPSRILLTHFGAIDNIETSLEHLNSWIDFMVETGQKRFSEGHRDSTLDEILARDFWEYTETRILDSLGRGLTEEDKEYLSLDITLNAMGVAYYTQKVNS